MHSEHNRGASIIPFHKPFQRPQLHTPVACEPNRKGGLTSFRSSVPFTGAPTFFEDLSGKPESSDSESMIHMMHINDAFLLDAAQNRQEFTRDQHRHLAVCGECSELFHILASYWIDVPASMPELESETNTIS